MTASLITSNTYAFADGNAGHVIDLGSAPNVGQEDVLCVNSNTVVTTPSGFTLRATRVGGQGSYIYVRKAIGGETQNVTITTSGNHDTAVGFSRWGNINADDTQANSGSDGPNDTTTPAHSTGTLASSTDLVIAFGALHGLTTTPTGPSWSTGFTGLTSVDQATTAGTGVHNFVGYKLVAGTAAEAPVVTWTNPATDRYMLSVSFTTTSGTITGNLGLVSESDTVQPMTRRKLRTETIISETDTVQPMTRVKKLTLGLITETETVQHITPQRSRTLGIVAETDTLLSLTRRKAHTLTQIAESDIALSLVRPAVTGHVPVLATITTGTPLATVKTKESITIISA